MKPDPGNAEPQLGAKTSHAKLGLGAPSLPPGYKQTEVGVIPEEWEVKSIAELGVIKTGPFGTLLKASEYSGTEGVPLISVGEVGAGAFKVKEHTPRVPKEVVRRLPQYVLRTGDIVFGRKGAVERSALVTENENGWFLGSDGISVRPHALCFPPYLACQFQRQEVQGWLLKHAIGTTMASLNQGILNRVQIPYAPLPEQRAIATALSDVDGLLGALDRLIAKKRDLKQAAMQQLLTGQTRLPGFKGEWVVKTLGDVACLKNGYAFKSDSYTNLGTLKVVTIANVQDGYMTAEACNTIASEPKDLQPHQRLSIGDILISMTGNVGRVCRVSEANCLLNQRVGKLVPTGITPDLLFVMLGQPSFILAMIGSAKGGAQPNLSATDITEHLFEIPKDVTEQTAIASVLSEMDAELAALEQRREKTRALKQGMMQELLTGRTRLVSKATPEVKP